MMRYRIKSVDPIGETNTSVTKPLENVSSGNRSDFTNNSLTLMGMNRLGHMSLKPVKTMVDTLLA